MHNLDALPQRDGRLDTAIGFLDIAKRFQLDRFGLGWSDRLWVRLGGRHRDEALCLLRLEEMPCGLSQQVQPAHCRRSWTHRCLSAARLVLFAGRGWRVFA
jgi:hypothetical protein